MAHITNEQRTHLRKDFLNAASVMENHKRSDDFLDDLPDLPWSLAALERANAIIDQFTDLLSDTIFRITYDAYETYTNYGHDVSMGHDLFLEVAGYSVGFADRNLGRATAHLERLAEAAHHVQNENLGGFSVFENEGFIYIE